MEAWARKYFGLESSLGMAIGDKNRNLKGHFVPAGSAFFELADQFYCQACHGEKIGALGEEVCRLSRYAWELTRAAYARNPLHSRLRISTLVEEIVLVLGQGARGILTVLGAHDTTLARLLTALESSIHAWPPYASSLLIES